MIVALATALRDRAAELGGLGLFVVAALDSSFLSLPQVNDLLVIYLSLRTPERMVYYASMTTLGSLAGCLALFAVGRRGGQLFLRRRFRARQVERGLHLYARFGLFSVLVPALLPPPTPFKLFVLLAGASGLPISRFVAAIVIGRGLRYFGQGWLAVAYGERAIDLARTHAPQAGLALAGLALLIGLAAYAWHRHRAAAPDA